MKVLGFLGLAAIVGYAAKPAMSTLKEVAKIIVATVTMVTPFVVINEVLKP